MGVNGGKAVCFERSTYGLGRGRLVNYQPIDSIDLTELAAYSTLKPVVKYVTRR